MYPTIVRAAGALISGFVILTFNACTLFNTLLSNSSDEELDTRLLASLIVANAQLSQKSSAYGPILFHQKTSDFANYTLEWIEAGAAGESGVPSLIFFQDQLSLATSGIKSPQIYNGRLIFIDSSSPGFLKVYDKDNPGAGAIASLSLGNSPQEIVISGTTGYVSVQNTFGTGGGSDGQILVLDLSNIDSPSISQTITTNVPRDPGDLILKNNLLYVQREGVFGNLQTGVDIFDIDNNFSQSYMSTGDGPLRLVDSGSKFFLVGTESGGNLTTFTGASDAASITAFPDTDGNSTNETPNFCSTIAFPYSGTGYITMTDDSGTTCELFTLNGSTGEIAATAIDAGTDYKYVGVGQRKNYLHRVSNGDGSASDLTIEIQDLGGATLNTFTTTKLGNFNHAFDAY